MKFGKTWEEANAESSSSGGDFFKWFKDGDTTFRVLQEPSEWLSYWEHYNPGGFPFPCTQDRKTCPGCTSGNEKMAKASRKVAIQVLEGDYTNVYKFPKTLADKLDNRYTRIGTLKDRDYTITRFSSKNADGSTKVDYDIEGGDKAPYDQSKVELKDVEAMLQRAYDEAWGDSSRAKNTKADADEGARQTSVTQKMRAAAARNYGDDQDPKAEKAPFEQGTDEVPLDEAELRKMEPAALWKIAVDGGLKLPHQDDRENMGTQDIVDWMLQEVG